MPGLAAARGGSGADARRRTTRGLCVAAFSAGAGDRDSLAGRVADGAVAAREGTGARGCGLLSGHRRLAPSRAPRPCAGPSPWPCRRVCRRRARVGGAARDADRRARRLLAGAVRPGRRGSGQHPDALDDATVSASSPRSVLRVRRAVGRLAVRGRRSGCAPALGIVLAVAARTACPRDPGRGVRSVPRLRRALPGDVHDPLRAASGRAARVPRGRAGSVGRRPRPSGCSPCPSRCTARTSAAGRSRHTRSRRRRRFDCSTTCERAAEATGVRPVLAMHRRESFDMRRPLLGWDGAMPPFARRLPAPPQHEWLEVVSTGTRWPRAGVVSSPIRRRTAIDLVQHASPFEYRWPLPYPVLIGGVRPNDMNWYVVDRPSGTSEKAGRSRPKRRAWRPRTIAGSPARRSKAGSAGARRAAR